MTYTVQLIGKPQVTTILKYEGANQGAATAAVDQIQQTLASTAKKAKVFSTQIYFLHKNTKLTRHQLDDFNPSGTVEEFKEAAAPILGIPVKSIYVWRTLNVSIPPMKDSDYFDRDVLDLSKIYVTALDLSKLYQ